MKAKAMEMKMKRIWNRLKDESGVGVVEVILILVDIFVFQIRREMRLLE